MTATRVAPRSATAVTPLRTAKGTVRNWFRRIWPSIRLVITTGTVTRTRTKGTTVAWDPATQRAIGPDRRIRKVQATALSSARKPIQVEVKITAVV